MDEGSRDVVVWRNALLRGTETFIVNQADALARYLPRYAGLQTVDSPLRVEPTLVLTGPGRLGGVRRRWLRHHRRDRRLAGLLRSPSVRLVHAHFGCDAVVVAPEAKRAGVPLVVSFHGYDVTRLPEDPRSGEAYRADLGRLFDSADLLLPASDFIAARLRGLGAPEHKLHRHYIGIPLPTSFTPPPPARRIVFAGRMVEVKGVDDLLTAVAALPAEHRQVPVRLYGDGPLRPALEERARVLGVRAEFLGHQPPARVQADLARGGVFAGPSRRSSRGDEEGLGMVFLEAAAHGLPVVSYRTGGVPEAVEHGTTGLLAPQGEVPALSAALARLLDDPELARTMGLAGRDRVARRFDVRRQTEQLELLYDGLPSPTVIGYHGAVSTS